MFVLTADVNSNTGILIGKVLFVKSGSNAFLQDFRNDECIEYTPVKGYSYKFRYSEKLWVSLLCIRNTEISTRIGIRVMYECGTDVEAGFQTVWIPVFPVQL